MLPSPAGDGKYGRPHRLEAFGRRGGPHPSDCSAACGGRYAGPAAGCLGERGRLSALQAIRRPRRRNGLRRHQACGQHRAGQFLADEAFAASLWRRLQAPHDAANGDGGTTAVLPSDGRTVRRRAECDDRGSTNVIVALGELWYFRHHIPSPGAEGEGRDQREGVRAHSPGHASATRGHRVCDCGPVAAGRSGCRNRSAASRCTKSAPP